MFVEISTTIEVILALLQVNASTKWFCNLAVKIFESSGFKNVELSC